MDPILAASLAPCSTRNPAPLASSVVSVLLATKIRSETRKPRIDQATIDLIKQTAQENRLWGVERIRGELLKLGIEVSKRTNQKYVARVRERGSGQQTWATFLKNHARDIWACDFTVPGRPAQQLLAQRLSPLTFSRSNLQNATSHQQIVDGLLKVCYIAEFDGRKSALKGFAGFIPSCVGQFFGSLTAGKPSQLEQN